ncbi:MAG: xanthine dehydrogenase family protein molybdopterin-binding subunit, partial [Solirubrobacteraceae bacterium]
MHDEGELHVAFVRSDLAHAKIESVDTSEAAALPGVRVLTAVELQLPALPAPPFLGIDPRFSHPLLASERVRFVGDIVAAVVAPTREAAADGAALVFVDYEPLPAVVDVRAAATDEVVIYEDVGTNICHHAPVAEPDEHIFDDCEVVIRGSNESPRLLACPIEPRSTRARFDDGKLTIHISTQTPHQDKMVLGVMLGLEAEQVRVVAPDVGGGFGGKGLDVEDVLLAALARALDAPLRWTETRSEHMVALHHGRAQWVDFELGADRDGRVKALRLKITQDAGAYPHLGAFLPHFTHMMSSGVYDIPKIEAEISSVVTNTTWVGAVRGAGRPEATQLIERAMDLLAAELGIDPVQVRRRNFIAADVQWPHQTAGGVAYDIGDYERALDTVL